MTDKNQTKVLFWFQIESNDSLPKYICTSCIDKLSVALEFKKTCQSSEKKFKTILNPMGKYPCHWKSVHYTTKQTTPNIKSIFKTRATDRDLCCGGLLEK